MQLHILDLSVHNFNLVDSFVLSVSQTHTEKKDNQNSAPNFASYVQLTWKTDRVFRELHHYSYIENVKFQSKNYREDFPARETIYLPKSEFERLSCTSSVLQTVLSPTISFNSNFIASDILVMSGFYRGVGRTLIQARLQVVMLYRPL